MTLLKTLLVGIIFHCVLLTAAQSKKENPSENLADYGIYPRSMHSALPQPTPPPLIPPPNQCIPNSCCVISINSMPLNPSIKIPAGYIHTPGVGIHKYHTEKINWNDARRTCVNEGGHLAVINSIQEQNLIHKVSAESNIEDEAWLGLHDLFNTLEWTTVLDVHIDNIGFINWAPGEPNHGANNEHCVTYKTSQNGMNDQDCAIQRPFFCEIPMP